MTIYFEDNKSPAVAKAHRVEVIAEDTLTITLVTGLNRQIRRMMAALGYEVILLRRLAFGPVSLGRLPVGKTRQLEKTELQALQKHIRRQQKLQAKPAVTKKVFKKPKTKAPRGF